MAYGFENDKEKANIENMANEMAADKVDKVSGKGLSENNFTTADKNIISGLTAALATKVDKIPGKGLSTLDFTSAYKTKIEESAYNVFGNKTTILANGETDYSQFNPFICPHDGYLILHSINANTGGVTLYAKYNDGVIGWYPILTIYSNITKALFVKKGTQLYVTAYYADTSAYAYYYPFVS